MNARRRSAPSIPSTPLARTFLTVEIDDLLASYTLRHTFRNDTGKAIEAVYSFPMPLDAAFGGMSATLAGETLEARVLPARQANRDYDAAVAEGDSAVLLEQLEPGLLCVSLGNLKPSEEGEIVLRFHDAIRAADGHARFSLPMVHRPRYGHSRLDALVTPRSDFAVEHPLEAEIRVRGLLARCPVQCGSPGARFAREGDTLVLQLEKAMLDRDLVLGFELGPKAAARARLVEDGEDSLAITAFTLPLPAETPSAPRDICLLLDGSGSMSGDAIAQSRAALQAITGALREDDRIQVIRFGSACVPLFRRPLKALPRVKDALRQLEGTIEADLGGTEMGAALDAALDGLLALDGPAESKVVILVTDGAVTPEELHDSRRRAAEAGVRVFTVAVGSSAGVDVLAPLSEATGGTLERAVPAEPVDAGVMRQFRRARSAPARVSIDWGDAGAQPLPLPVAYPGDSVLAVAACSGHAERVLGVRVDGTATLLALPTGPACADAGWRAWAGQRRHAHAEDEAGREALALRYGLVTPETKAVLVKRRAEDDKAEGLPVVVPVAQMVPEGMVGALGCVNFLAMPMDAHIMACSMPPRGGSTLRDMPHSFMDISAAAMATTKSRPKAGLLRRLMGLHEMALDEDATTASSASLPAANLPREVADALATAIARLLLAGSTACPWQDVLQAIAAPELRESVEKLCGLPMDQAVDLPALLQELLDNGAALALDDEEDAALSLALVP